MRKRGDISTIQKLVIALVVLMVIIGAVFMSVNSFTSKAKTETKKGTDVAKTIEDTVLG